MKTKIALALLASAPLFAVAQSLPQTTAKHPFSRLNPATMQAIYKQNDQKLASKTDAIAERLIATASLSSDGSADSSKYFYSGTNGSTLDLKTDKGYFEATDFFSADEVSNYQASARVKYLITDSSTRRITFPGFDIAIYNRSKYNAAKQITSNVNVYDFGGTPNMDSAILSYNSANKLSNGIQFNDYSGSFGPGTLGFYTYNAAGLIALDSFVDLSNIPAEPSAKNEYIYDATGSLTNLKSYNYNGTGFDQTRNVNLTYDGSNRLILRIETDDQGSIITLDSMTYTSGNFPSALYSSQEDMNGVISPASLTTFTFQGATNEIDSIYSFTFNPDSSQYFLEQIGKATYNSSMHLNKFFNFSLDESGNTVSTSTQTFYYENYNTTVGIQELSSSSLKFSPNPFTNNIKIANGKVANWKITDITGRLVAFGKGGNSEVTTIETAQLPQGLYILSATDTDGNTTTQKMAKQ